MFAGHFRMSDRQLAIYHNSIRQEVSETEYLNRDRLFTTGSREGRVHNRKVQPPRADCYHAPGPPGANLDGLGRNREKIGIKTIAGNHTPYFVIRQNKLFCLMS